MKIHPEKYLETLSHGEISLKGEFMWGSNYTFLTEVEYMDEKIIAVYKPSRGERPLWDFPSASLARREVAAYYVSEALGWNFVPPTVFRANAPLGPGSLQLFVEHDPEYHYFNFNHVDQQRLRPVALFDLLINNADRKGSHILIDNKGKLWLIDHGLCFHAQDKLRTVIWDFIGEEIQKELYNDIALFVEKLENRHDKQPELVALLGKYLSTVEIDALIHRGERILNTGFFPTPEKDRRHYPWPQV